MIGAGQATGEFREMLRGQVAYARAMFGRGSRLIGMVDRELALDLDLFTRGGLEILQAIEARQYDVLSARPRISGRRKAMLLVHALAGRLLPGEPRSGSSA
jgi:phytoene/squalene synthetase